MYVQSTGHETTYLILARSDVRFVHFTYNIRNLREKLLWGEYLTFFPNLSQSLLLQFKEDSRELFHNDEIGLWISIALMQTKKCSAANSRQIIPTVVFRKETYKERGESSSSGLKNQDTKLSVKIVFFNAIATESLDAPFG